MKRLFFRQKGNDSRYKVEAEGGDKWEQKF